MIVGADSEYLSVGRDELHRHQVVDRQTVLAHDPAETASERQAAYSSGRDDATRRREAMHLRFPIELGPRRAALSARDARLRIDVDGPHQREIDHHALIDHGPTGYIVAAAAYGHGETVLAGKSHGLHDVGRSLAACDQGRLLVDESVV